MKSHSSHLRHAVYKKQGQREILSSWLIKCVFSSVCWPCNQCHAGPLCFCCFYCEASTWHWPSAFLLSVLWWLAFLGSCLHHGFLGLTKPLNDKKKWHWDALLYMYIDYSLRLRYVYIYPIGVVISRKYARNKGQMLNSLNWLGVKMQFSKNLSLKSGRWVVVFVVVAFFLPFATGFQGRHRPSLLKSYSMWWH